MDSLLAWIGKLIGTVIAGHFLAVRPTGGTAPARRAGSSLSGEPAGGPGARDEGE